MLTFSPISLIITEHYVILQCDFFINCGVFKGEPISTPSLVRGKRSEITERAGLDEPYGISTQEV